MIDLRETVKRLNAEGVPIRYPTVYQWAKNGIYIGTKKVKFASKVGNYWLVTESKIQEVLNGIRRGENVRVQRHPGRAKNGAETRGRKPGTKFGTYSRRGKDDSDGVQPVKSGPVQ